MKCKGSDGKSAWYFSYQPFTHPELGSWTGRLIRIGSVDEFEVWHMTEGSEPLMDPTMLHITRRFGRYRKKELVIVFRTDTQRIIAAARPDGSCAYIGQEVNPDDETVIDGEPSQEAEPETGDRDDTPVAAEAAPTGESADAPSTGSA